MSKQVTELARHRVRAVENWQINTSGLKGAAWQGERERGIGIGVSRQSDVSRESRSNVWGESHVLYQLRFIPACGMLQQVVFVVLTAVQTSAAEPRVDAGVTSKLPCALLDVFHCWSLNYSSV